MGNIALGHSCLEEFVRMPQFSQGRYALVALPGKMPRVVEWLLPRIPLSPIRQIVYQGCLHAMMTGRALKVRGADAVIVMEFLPVHMILFFPILKIAPQRFIFFVHGFQQLSLNNPVNRVALKIFQWLRFRAIQFELPDHQLPARLRLDSRRCLVVPMPVLSKPRLNLNPGERKAKGRVLRIGVVGVIRPGKPLARLAGKLKEVIAEKFQEAKLVVGSPKWPGQPSFVDEEIETVDTGDLDNYYDLLTSLDIAVYVFERDDYEYRASAAMADAISCGVHVVCPDYPVFRHQVTQPARVGTVFSSEAGMEDAIRQALAEVKEHGYDRHWDYREGRQAPDFARYFDAFLLD